MPAPSKPAPSPAPARAAHRLHRRAEERVEALGGVLDLVLPAEVFHFVSQRRAAGRQTIIANHNLHSLHLIRRDPDFAAFFAMADLIEVDSTPLILWARLIGRPSRRFHRCTYLDWREAFWARASAEGWRVFFLGGQPGVGEAARAAILGRWPEVQLSVRHGHFDMDEPSENAAALAAIRDARPDILFVGMGMPRQELWVARHRRDLPACAIFTVGGAFDYEAGVQATCPRWIGRIGLEWLFRLARDPRRLFHRYMVEPIDLLGPAMADLARALRRPAAAR